MENRMIERNVLDAAFDERFPRAMKDRLMSAKVAVAGLGGLGSNIAVYLARTWVGHLLLVDFDTVDVTNLNRQVYMIQHLGRQKTEALKEILQMINPYLEVKTKQVKVTNDNLETIFREYPIVCEAFDRPDQKAMLINGILTRCPDTTIVSGNGMAGYGRSNDIVTSQTMRRLYVCGDNMSDSTKGIGLTAARVAICAGHEANKVIELIVDGK